MSIKYGLIREEVEITDGGGLISLGLNNASTYQKLAASFVFGGGCYSSSDKLMGAKYPLTYSLKNLYTKEYSYSLAIYDSVTKELVDPELLTYKFLYNNLSTDNFTINKNNSTFNIVFPNLPKKDFFATVRVTGEDYLEIIVQISANIKTTKHIHNVGIVNINNVPDGVSIVNTVLQQNENGIDQEYVLSFPSSSTKYEESTITIPEGTKFYDKNHNLLEGPINVKIGHFSPTTALNLFASGWNVASLEYNDQVLHNVGFISGGFYSVNISDNEGNLATTIF